MENRNYFMFMTAIQIIVQIFNIGNCGFFQIAQFVHYKNNNMLAHTLWQFLTTLPTYAHFANSMHSHIHVVLFKQ